MSDYRDLIVTWPKSRVLGSYLAELRNAERLGLKINYRVHRPPDREALFGAGGVPRVYRVHNGFVRGYTPLSGVLLRGENEVARVEADAMSGFWPAGWYLVCEPIFHRCAESFCEGFRGWRWFDRTLVEP